MKKKVDYSELIPELSALNDGRGISVDGWLQCVGNFELAIAFGQFFWPGFVEHDGCVLFEDFSEINYQSFLQFTKGNRASVEWVLNHRHILDLFSTEKTCNLPQILHLGRTLKAIYSTKLASDFPDRRFIVEFNEGPFEDWIEYQISFFWQPSNASGDAAAGQQGGSV